MRRMLFELPAESSVSLFDGVLGFAVLLLAMRSMGGVGTVWFVQGLVVLPFVALTGNRAKKESGGSGGKERSQFHPAAGCSGSITDGKRRK